MSMKMKQINYSAPPIQILATPDHYVNIGYKHPRATQENPGLAILEGGRWVVKAGTIYPSNDSNAVGIVFTDYDVTDGDNMMAIVIHGFIKTAALRTIPTANAVAAMKQITFLPLVGAFTIGLEPVTPLTYTAGATTVTTRQVQVQLTNGLFFRDGATNKANWTVTGESTTKVTLSTITLSPDKKVATLNLTTTSTALVAGNITVLAGAACVSVGMPMGSAVTVATVA